MSKKHGGAKRADMQRRFLVCAYDAQGKPIMGNCDGQGFFWASHYWRCKWFHALCKRALNPPLHSNVAYYKVYQGTSFESKGKLIRTLPVMHASTQKEIA